MTQPPILNYEVDLPAGGKMYLQTAEEVDLWTKSHRRYIEDYQLTKTNDLVLLGAILQQQVTMFRAQRALNGLEPELDNAGVPTGRYAQVKLDADQTSGYLKMLNTASGELRQLEKALGIDKATREAGGSYSLSGYLRTLKSAAHERGIHIAQRTLKYEKFVNELRWRLRVMRNADAEDRAYHDLTPEKVLDWCYEELQALEQVDKEFAHQKGKLYVGKL